MCESQSQLEALTGNPYFFCLVWQWWELPHPDSTFPRGQCSPVAGATWPIRLRGSKRGLGGSRTTHTHPEPQVVLSCYGERQGFIHKKYPIAGPKGGLIPLATCSLVCGLCSCLCIGLGLDTLPPLWRRPSRGTKLARYRGGHGTWGWQQSTLWHRKRPASDPHNNRAQT